MTPGLLGFDWTVAQIQAIKIGVTFVLKKKKHCQSVCGGFFLLCSKEPTILTIRGPDNLSIDLWRAIAA